MEQNMLKTTLKAPKTNKATAGIIGVCSSAKEVGEAIDAFWGNSGPAGDEKFILKKLTQLVQLEEPSDSLINSFTAMTKALMGGTLKSAKENMFMKSSMLYMQFVVPAAQVLGVNWAALGDERAWKFVFVSGDCFRIRSAIKTWKAATSVEDRDAAAAAISGLIQPLQEGNRAIKSASVALLLSRAGDLLDNRAVNLFPMMKTSAERPNAATINQDQADAQLDATKQGGSSLLNSLVKPADQAISAARQLVSNLLNAPDSVDLHLLETKFPKNASAVKDALLNLRFGFGSAMTLDGCQNYLQSNSGSTNAAQWLKDFIKAPIESVQPVIDTLRDKILGSSVVSEADAMEWVSGIKISKMLMDEYNVRESRPNGFIEDLRDVFRIAGGQIKTLKSIDLNRGRSFASQAKQVVSLNPRGGKRVLWHEVGHHFEYSNPDCLKLALSFLTERAGSTGAIRPLNEFFQSNYSDSEVAITDKLSSPYAGKVYGPDHSRNVHASHATEIFSTAFEYLADSKGGAVSLLNDDQLMQFVCGILKGVHKL